MYRHSVLAGAILAAAVTTVSASCACAQEFTADLKGVNEIGSIPTAVTITTLGSPSPTGYTGAVLSNGTGTAKLDLNKNAGTVTFTLTYSNVGTTAPQTGTVSQAHIHFGKSRDSGGILVFFCTNLTFNGTGPTPQACPANSGTVSGTWTKDNVQAIPGQNVVAGDFNALVVALESNTAYANVHTVPPSGATDGHTAYPGGEIRGQVHEVEDQQGQDQNQQGQNQN
jgi:CHRD domain